MIEFIERKTKRTLLRKVFLGARACQIIWKDIKIKRAINVWRKMADKFYAMQRRQAVQKIISRAISLKTI